MLIYLVNLFKLKVIFGLNNDHCFRSIFFNVMLFLLNLVYIFNLVDFIYITVSRFSVLHFKKVTITKFILKLGRFNGSVV